MYVYNLQEKKPENFVLKFSLIKRYEIPVVIKVFVALYFQAVSLHHGANGQNVQRHAMVQVNSSGTVTTLTPTIQPSTVTKHW